MKVKICANKSILDAEMAIKAGADMIGVLVGQTHTSSDFVDKETAKSICNYARPKCDVVLVTHLINAEEIIELSCFIGNNYLQLHSNISESEVEKIYLALPSVKIIRVLHLTKNGGLLTDFSTIKYVDYYLLDSINTKTNQIGGTGISYDWEKACKIIKKLKKPVFLAGGLTPSNVKEAINLAKPFGVDVNSGCKTNGKKDSEKIIAFVKNAKQLKNNT